MARSQIAVTVGTAYKAQDGKLTSHVSVTGGPGSVPKPNAVATMTAAAAAYVTAAATVATDIATLVTDGAAPTQAHVNTLNTDYTALATAYTALAAAIATSSVAANSGDLLVDIDLSKIATVTKLSRALEAVLSYGRGSATLTL